MDGALRQLPIVGSQIYLDARALIRFSQVTLIFKEHERGLLYRVLDVGPAPSQEWAALVGRPGDYLSLRKQDQLFAETVLSCLDDSFERIDARCSVGAAYMGNPPREMFPLSGAVKRYIRRSLAEQQIR